MKWCENLTFATRGKLFRREILLFFLVLLHACPCVITGSLDTWNVTCPSKCKCADQKTSLISSLKVTRTVDCSHGKLKEIPSNIPFDTEALILRDNGLSQIALGALDNFQDLRLLDLSYNVLPNLGSWPLFKNLSSLQVLNLQGNHFTSIKQGDFDGLTQLEELVLSLNAINAIDNQAFGGLASLQTLVLSHNNVKEIHSEWFANLPALQNLYLDHNRLTVLNGGSFLGTNSLAKLFLSQNNLTVISSDSFLGLSSLTQLDLSYNGLTAVPSLAFAALRRLKLLTLDGNSIRILEPGSFQRLLVSELSLCNMSSLLSIDMQSFVKLPQLHTLRINSNKRLTFIHPQALENLPGLEYLYLHDNAIVALSAELVLSLPSLQEFSFYDNPLQCDCNAFWLRSALTNRTFYPVNHTTMDLTPSVDHVTFQKPRSYICEQPASLRSKALVDLPLGTLDTTCAPTIIGMFQSSYQRELGKSIVYECRAIGVPFPNIHWILSNKQILNNTSNDSRIRVSRTGTLSISHLKARDAGTYTCVATNEPGFDTKSTSLQVHSKNIQIINLGASSNFIRVTWNGTQSTIDTSDYMIQYRRQGSRDKYKSVHLRPYMRTYTISDLEPETAYECCIVYEHSKEIVKLNCMTIQTRSQLMHRIRTISKLTILLALCLTSLGVILICVLMVIIRRYQRRKSYQEPGASANTSTTGLSGGSCKGQGARGQRFGPPDPVNYKVGQISNIPLDNLYNPPRTPLCTSTTSLISTQSNA